MSTLRMIVGLGNPGPRYNRNRHNIGFQCIERFAHRHNLTVGRSQHNSLTGDGWISKNGARAKVLLVKPLTFMNRSGQAVAPLVNYYDVEPQNLIVIHDDLDLESGKLRLRAGGSSGGQNGIKSIIAGLGFEDFHRLRVGIGRPDGYMDAAAYVLQDFSTDEEEVFTPLRDRICDALEAWMFDGIDVAMNRYNG
ncbi:MAG: aminoacyl-tRNA hydrolase [Litorilinea sp.]